LVAIVIAFKYSCGGCLNINQAVAAIIFMLACVELRSQFEVATVTLLPSIMAAFFLVGFK
jgi:hypothetical protein